MLRRKGKFISKKQLSQRSAASERLKQLRNGQSMDKNALINADEPEHDESGDITSTIRPGEGRRIIELDTLQQQVWCKSCKEALSLAHIEREKFQGLASTLSIR